MKPKISIITSTYWRPDLLSRCIQSVQRSTMRDYEHIIIGDHDPFPKAVYEEYSEDDRIKYYEVPGPYKYNLGAAAFRVGRAKATSDYICYALDDDLAHTNHLQVHYDIFKSTNNEASLTLMETANLPGEMRNVKAICSLSFEGVQKFVDRKKHNDVAALSHIRNIKETWPYQSDLNSGLSEDDEYIKRINAKENLIEEVTCMKVGWGGHRKKIKGEKVGVDTDYYELLKEKLVEDKRTHSGFRMESDTPYAYPEFKDTLYGE